MFEKDVFAPGLHLLVDHFGGQYLTDSTKLECALIDAAEAAGATVLSHHFHHFGDGSGVTGVVVLAESHISIHTWPERQYAAIDIFMCGAAQPYLAAQSLEKTLKPERVIVSEIARGQSNQLSQPDR